MPICAGSKRVNCVVDGDTIWLNGEKIRLESFNTPEVNGKCNRERQLARQATRRLSQILSSRPFTVVRSGYDIYGRRLAFVSTASGGVGGKLIREGLAHEWHGRKQSWCE
ncbi:MAG: thermonuclease family protein [Gammaproteobacteria bacterium]|nr:thermonuclease family protein [Gammaproteobacteria bacterium]